MADECAERIADATRVWLAPHDPAWAEMAAAEGAHPENSLAYNNHKALWIRTRLDRANAWSAGG